MTIKVETYKDIPENYTGIAEYPDGSKYWFLNGNLHRTGGPAVEYADRRKEWFLNDKLHRTDGPAVEYPDGRKEWYLNGKRYTKEEHFQYVAKHYPEHIRRLIWSL